MDIRLDGRKALVTGASMGIGLAIARALADAGADVAMLARRPAPLEEAAAAIATHTRRQATPCQQPGCALPTAEF